MRLTPQNIQVIKETISRFDINALVYLFGSKTDDAKKGGDIDLLILSQVISFRNCIDIKLSLYDTLGEQKIDILLAHETTKPMVKIALAEGVLL